MFYVETFDFWKLKVCISGFFLVDWKMILCQNASGYVTPSVATFFRADSSKSFPYRWAWFKKSYRLVNLRIGVEKKSVLLVKVRIPCNINCVQLQSLKITLLTCFLVLGSQLQFLNLVRWSRGRRFSRVNPVVRGMASTGKISSLT
jgi:hypothetical protein